MEFKNQVSNYKLSNRLKELGVKQDSYFYWFKSWFTLLDKKGKEYKYYISTKKSDEKDILEASAFTVAELGEMLPFTFEGDLDEGYYVYEYTYGDGEYVIWYKWNLDENVNNKFIMMQANTEANVRAVMLIHLIENKLIKVGK